MDRLSTSDHALRGHRWSLLLLAILAVAAVAAIPITVYAGTPDGGAPRSAGQPRPVRTSPTTSSTDAPPAGCPKTKLLPAGQSIAIDYVDFVHFAGHEYVRAWVGRPGRHYGLGSRLGDVDCTIAYLVGDYRHAVIGPMTDGDAAFLPVGTVVHAVRGLDPQCAIGVVREGDVVVYRAYRNFDEPGAVPRGCARR